MSNWSSLSEFICQPKNFIDLYTQNEDYKFDLVRYWRYCTENTSDIVSTFVRSITKANHNATIDFGIKFLQDVAAYEPAEQLCRILVKNVGSAGGSSSRTEVAEAKATLAYLLRLRGQYKEAASLFEEVLSVLEPIYQNQANEKLGAIYNSTLFEE